MSTLVYIDIETLPGDTAPEIEAVNLEDYAIGNCPKYGGDLKKQKQWEVAQGVKQGEKYNQAIKANEAKQKEQHAKQALNSMQGTIFCVSLAIEDGPVETFTGDEVIVLDSLFGRLEEFLNPVFVGHNIYFDLGFLYHKSILNKSKLRHILPKAKDRGMVIDTQKEWNLGQYGKYTKLSDIAAFLGIEQKDEINGSQVWEAYKRGNFDQIIAHCESDVEVVRALNKLL